MCVVWNYEQSGGPFKLSKKRVMHAKKKKRNSSFFSLRSDENKTEQSPLIKSSSLSLSSPLSHKSWSKFVPRHVFHHNE